MATAHISANIGEFSSTVIMAGDPLRAKFIAETYLNDYELVTDVRNILGYTGFYKGKRISVMGHGMGMASAGIYFYELFKFYNVDTIIRIGSCGSYLKDINLYDLILVEGAYSESNFAKVQSNEQNNILYSNKDLNDKILFKANSMNINLVKGNIHSTDVFYNDNVDIDKLTTDYKCLAVEMESFALFQTAKLFNKNAACLLTVSDNLITKEEISSEKRQKSFIDMIELALESV